MAVLFVEPFGGLAGDMFLAALLDLDDPRFSLEALREIAARLVPGEARLEVRRAWRGNLSGTLLDVQTPESNSAPHRGLAELTRLIEAADLGREVGARAVRVLRRIAEAEAEVHGTTVEQIHFHEVGAVDTLVDVVGACYALERLGVDEVLSSVPLAGEGTVRCAHGEMPVPAPATAQLLRGRALALGGGPGERLTPTGAALLAELTLEFGSPGPFRARALGYGAGHRDPQHGPPNMLRVQLGERGEEQGEPARAGAGRATVWQLDVNLDDMSAEEIGYAIARLRRAGALEVWSSPLSMKKDRPGALLSALCRPAARGDIEAEVFEHTSSFGLRWSLHERAECGRRSLEVEVQGQTIRVKLRERPSYPGRSPLGPRDVAPEHDDLVRAAEALGLDLRTLRDRAVSAALASLGE